MSVEAAVAFAPSAFTPQASPFDFDSSTMSPEHMFTGTPSIADSEELHDHDGKPTKKRRSWGQQLPTPTTNLPPRKRAKTEAEKEQRRIERVIRNRLAAHSSRERKRKEVESLEGEKQVVESENSKLRAQLLVYATENAKLARQVKALQAELGRPLEELEIKLELPPSPPHSPKQSTPAADICEPLASPVASAFADSMDSTQHPAEML